MSSPGLAERAPATEPRETADDGYVAYGLSVLEKHVHAYQERYEYDHGKGGTVPRNHDWRPYRYCIQDVLFGAVVVRHHRDGHHLVVDVLLPAAIEGYEPDAGAHALILFVLAEAYKCGGTMEIEFTENVALPCSPRCGVCRHLAGGRRCGAPGADKVIVLLDEARDGTRGTGSL